MLSAAPAAVAAAPPVLSPFAIPELFTPHECAEIVALAEAEGLREAGLVRGRRNESIRAARTAWLDDEGAAGWVFARIVEAVRRANGAHFGFALTEFAERAQVARYDAAEDGHFDWHADIGGGPLAARRKLTLVAQLTDAEGYRGGALELNATGRPECVDRRRGSAVLFPSFTLHRVARVETGRRFSLTTWAHGPAFV